MKTTASPFYWQRRRERAREIRDALQTLRREGKIQSIGTRNFSTFIKEEPEFQIMIDYELSPWMTEDEIEEHYPLLAARLPL